MAVEAYLGFGGKPVTTSTMKHSHQRLLSFWAVLALAYAGARVCSEKG